MVTDDAEDSLSRGRGGVGGGAGQGGASGMEYEGESEGHQEQHLQLNGHDVHIVEDQRSPAFHSQPEDEAEEQVGRFSIRDE
jgi:hypothetical protein